MKPTDGLREIVPVERWTVCVRADTPSRNQKEVGARMVWRESNVPSHWFHMEDSTEARSLEFAANG